MKCPVCSVSNPGHVVSCNCGYHFTTQTKALYRSFTHMGVGEFFSNSWRMYGAAWTTFLLLGAIYTVVSRGLSLGTGVAPGTVSIVIRWIALILTTMALMMAAHKVSEGEPVGVGESYTLSLWLFWRYVGTTILYFLMVFGGLMFFIIPGIIWGIRYVLAFYAVIIEGLDVREAFSRSAALTKGKIISILFHEIAFVLLLTLVIAIPVALLTRLIAVGPEGEEAIRTFGATIWEALFVIFNVLLFKSLRRA